MKELINRGAFWLPFFKKDEKKYITKIKEKDKEVTDVKEIKKIFEHFYKKLYKKPNIKLEKVIKYLEGKNG